MARPRSLVVCLGLAMGFRGGCCWLVVLKMQRVVDDEVHGDGDLKGGRTLLTLSCGGAWPRNAVADTQASRQAKHCARRGILIQQSILGSLPLWNKAKVYTKTHQGMYTGELTYRLG